MQAQLNRCNLPFSLEFSPHFRGLCIEWKITNPVEALSHKNTSLYVFLIPQRVLKEFVKDESALQRIKVSLNTTVAFKTTWCAS